MSIFWQDGQFSWFLIGVAIYLVLLLLVSDLLWRLTRIGGRTVLLLAFLAALVGVAMLWRLST